MSNQDKQALASACLVNKQGLAIAKAKLLNIMEDNESFDFTGIDGNTYRCYRRPEITVSRPKINKDKGTFVMQAVVISPTIFIRKINKRKELS